MIFLAKAECAFSVPTRGWVVVPAGFTDADSTVKAGDAIQLRGSESSLNTRINSIEWLVRKDGGNRVGFLLSVDKEYSELGCDVEIWVEPSN